jgi:hypothetical protein
MDPRGPHCQIRVMTCSMCATRVNSRAGSSNWASSGRCNCYGKAHTAPVRPVDSSRRQPDGGDRVGDGRPAGRRDRGLPDDGFPHGNGAHVHDPRHVRCGDACCGPATHVHEFGARHPRNRHRGIPSAGQGDRAGRRDLQQHCRQRGCDAGTQCAQGSRRGTARLLRSAEWPGAGAGSCAQAGRHRGVCQR